MSTTSTVEYTHTCVIVFIVLLFIVLQCQRRQLSSILTLVLYCYCVYRVTFHSLAMSTTSTVVLQTSHILYSFAQNIKTANRKTNKHKKYIFFWKSQANCSRKFSKNNRCTPSVRWQKITITNYPVLVLHMTKSIKLQWTRGQSNLTKSASRGAHSPVRGHPRGSKVVPLNSWGRVSY